MSIAEALRLLGDTWPTVVLSVVLGLGGGVVGALIGAAAQNRQARDARGEAARTKLRAYERGLLDWSIEDESKIIRDGTFVFTKTSLEDVARAREEAFPFADYLPARKQHLVKSQMADMPDHQDDPLLMSTDLWKRGQELGRVLDARFDRRWFGARWVTRLRRFLVRKRGGPKLRRIK